MKAFNWRGPAVAVFHEFTVLLLTFKIAKGVLNLAFPRGVRYGSSERPSTFGLLNIFLDRDQSLGSLT
jgi:hypothetical protein